MVSKSITFAFAAIATVAFAQAPVESKDGPGYPKTSFGTDESDLWWNPNESGWGMQLVQQGGLIFATLFIYGPDSKPTWAVAQIDYVGQATWSGPLYLTSGPWFGGLFNAGSVGVRQAGTLTFSAPVVSKGTVTYAIDGVSVTKQVQRQTLTLDNYNGNYVTAINLTQSSCSLPSDNGSFNGLMNLSINQNGNTMSMFWSLPFGTCSYSGSYFQDGRMAAFSGNYSCSNGDVGAMNLVEMTNRVGMVSGRISGRSSKIGCNYTGRFTGLDPSRP
jgi:hypothetical protein